MSPVCCVKEDLVVKTGVPLYRFERFGFLAGGTMNLSISVSTPLPVKFKDETTEEVPVRYPVFFLLCTDEQVAQLSSRLSTSLICSDSGESQVSPGDCSDYFRFTSEESLYHMHRTVPTSMSYSFLLHNCRNQYYVAEISYLLLNGNGEHLSKEYLHLPLVYLAALSTWGFLTLMVATLVVLGLTNRVPHRRWFLVVPGLAISRLMFTYFFWRSFSLDGVRAVWVEAGYYVLYAGFKGGLFAVTLLIAKGSQITCSSIDSTERRKMFFAVFWITLSLFLYGRFEGLFMIVLVVVYIVVLRLLFVGSTVNISTLRRQCDILLQYLGESEALTPLRRKLALYNGFRWGSVMYVSCQITLLSLSAFVEDGINRWLLATLEEFSDIALCMTLGSSLVKNSEMLLFAQRPRDRSRFPSLFMFRSRRRVSTAGSISEDAENASHMLPSPVFVVEQPDTYDAYGNLIPTYSLAVRVPDPPKWPPSAVTTPRWGVEGQIITDLEYDDFSWKNFPSERLTLRGLGDRLEVIRDRPVFLPATLLTTSDVVAVGVSDSYHHARPPVQQPPHQHHDITDTECTTASSYGDCESGLVSASDNDCEPWLLSRHAPVWPAPSYYSSASPTPSPPPLLSSLRVINDRLQLSESVFEHEHSHHIDCDSEGADNEEEYEAEVETSEDDGGEQSRGRSVSFAV